MGCSSLPVVDNIRYAGFVLVGVADATKTSYKIRKGTRVIGNGAFSGCKSLKSLTIPETVTDIGLFAFSGCKSLQALYCKPTTPPSSVFTTFEGGAAADIWQSMWVHFGDMANEYPFIEIKTKIYVPRKSLQSYKSDYGWGVREKNIFGYDF